MTVPPIIQRTAAWVEKRGPFRQLHPPIPEATDDGYLIEPHICPDCDTDCIGNPDGSHTCWDCGIVF